MEDAPHELRAEILALVSRYFAATHGKVTAFVPGETRVPYAGRVFDANEMTSLVGASLDFWLTAGPVASQFESRMRAFFGSKDFRLVNSGSSANLLMVATLTAQALPDFLRPDDPRPLETGDEVVTPAVTFPTTLAPLIQHGLTPVFVDCDVDTCNINVAALKRAIGPRTRALMLPHTLGLPFDLDAVMEVVSDNNLWLLEDGCDALGATWNGKLVGTFGALSSLSFFPAHHMTMGEGGGVVVNHPRLQRVVASMRDWGRDCWCDPGKSDTCGKRFNWQLGSLPPGYDHKYIYTNVGYNLKATDLQAAIGVAQIEKVPQFIEQRRRNFQRLEKALASLDSQLVLPRIDTRANPSPFGFPLTVRDPSTLPRLVQHLEARKIETRQVFAGNILRQPGFQKIAHRLAGTLANTDVIMKSTIFVGVYPKLTDEIVDYVADSVREFFSGRLRA